MVWFGEALPPEALQAAVRAAETCDVFFTIGTSSIVYPAADLPYQAVEHGALAVEVNPQATPFSVFATYSLSGPSGVVLPELLRAAWPLNSDIIPGDLQ